MRRGLRILFSRSSPFASAWRILQGLTDSDTWSGREARLTAVDAPPPDRYGGRPNGGLQRAEEVEEMLLRVLAERIEARNGRNSRRITRNRHVGFRCLVRRVRKTPAGPDRLDKVGRAAIVHE